MIITERMKIYPISMEKLKELTKRSDEEIAIIDEILNSHFVIGRHNKEKIIADFKEKLNLNDEEADNLYKVF